MLIEIVCPFLADILVSHCSTRKKNIMITIYHKIKEKYMVVTVLGFWIVGVSQIFRLKKA
jgi:hypothetical protein